MDEKVYLNDAEKIELLELNSKILARQNEAMAIKERFIVLNDQIPRMQKELDELIKKIVKNHGYENGNIANDYSIILDEVK